MDMIVNGNGPAVTQDIEQAFADLSVFGACIIENALDAKLLREAHDAVYRIADGDTQRGWRRNYDYGKDDHINQRIWNLPSRDPVFCDIAEHPLAIRIVKHVLGWPASLSSMSANITAGGGGKMILHTDQGYVPGPWSRPWVVNLGWCADDFTVENGATLFAPGTHLLNRNKEAGEPEPEMIPAVAPAGSLIVMDGRLWHTNGHNTNGVRRAGLFTTYTLPILLPQENWAMSLNPIIRQQGSETLQTLFGFRPQVLGRVNGLERI